MLSKRNFLLWSFWRLLKIWHVYIEIKYSLSFFGLFKPFLCDTKFLQSGFYSIAVFSQFILSRPWSSICNVFERIFLNVWIINGCSLDIFKNINFTELRWLFLWFLKYFCMLDWSFSTISWSYAEILVFFCNETILICSKKILSAAFTFILYKFINVWFIKIWLLFIETGIEIRKTFFSLGSHFNIFCS